MEVMLHDDDDEVVDAPMKSNRVGIALFWLVVIVAGTVCGVSERDDGMASAAVKVCIFVAEGVAMVLMEIIGGEKARDHSGPFLPLAVFFLLCALGKSITVLSHIRGHQ